MPHLIDAPALIPAEGNKVIQEFVGRARTGDERVSVAQMQSPPGWTEPFQTPEFLEITVVLEGTLHVDGEGGPMQVAAGQAIVVEPGVEYRTVSPGGARYVAICLPAFSPDTVHRHTS